MRVLKRDNTYEKISFDKVLNRISSLSKDLTVLSDEIAQKVCSRIYDGVKTSDLDELAAQLCSSMIIDHPDYGTLASRLIVSNHHKNTSPSFSETIYLLYKNKDINNESNPLVSKEVFDIVMTYKDKLNNFIKYDRDYNFDYFGFKTLERSYLIKINGKIIERPQHLFMRVALGIHGLDFKDALETYEYMSQQYFIHATPTLFNAGTNKANLSSCFLLDVHDSVEGMYDLAKECALISKGAGGIGINIHDIRSKNSIVRGSNGKSSGIVPMLRVFNAISRHIDQCFIPETIIYTEDGPKQICEITTTDKVITIDGKYKKVNEIFKTEVNKDILDIRTARSFESISVTKEHQLYVLRGQKKMTNFNDIKRRLNAKTIKGEFISAKDLKDDDMVAYPVINLEDTDQTINDDLSNYYRMIGIMLGDGHITENKNEAGITVNKESKIKTYNFVKEFLNFNKINYWETDQTNCVQLRWTNTNKFDLTRDEIYDSTKDKYVNSKFMKLNKHYTKQIIKGLIETDGCITGEISFCTTSYNLAHSIRYLLLKIGIVSSGCVKDYRGKTHEIRPGEFITNKKISYYIRIPKVKELTDMLEIEEGTFFKSFTHGDKIWSRVISINERHYEGNVYDLNIEDNHNYVVGSFGLVHNSGKRNGSIAVYCCPWHPDIMAFLDLRKNSGAEEERCRDLFLALWVSDLFMKRVKADAMWSLFDPDECRNLTTTYGDEFEKLYLQYEENKKYRKQVKAQEVWFKIIESQIETGTPYILFKDAVNKKSNQKNLGAIKSSNLCTEICLFTNHKDEIAVCNLASICLPKYINADDNTYNHKELHKMAKLITKNLNKVIDRNYYVLKKAENSNRRHRPIGIGIQGLSDVFALLKFPFESVEAKKLNKEIFETIYHGALEASMEIAQKRKEWYNISSLNKTYLEKWKTDNSLGEDPYIVTKKLDFISEELDNLPNNYIGAYSSFVGSPASQGLLQFDLWDKTPDSGRYNWDELKLQIKEHGIRNSMLLAPMPTASTSQICGFNESFECFNSMIYKRRTLSGEFILVNKYLRKDLLDLNMWNKEMKEKILLADGSIQNIEEIPQELKDLYKTVWEIKMKAFIDLSIDRGQYICQSQSLNLFFAKPEYKLITSALFYGHSKGLKTGSYYIRSKPKAKTQMFSIEPTKVNTKKEEVKKEEVEDQDTCLSCGS